MSRRRRNGRPSLLLIILIVVMIVTNPSKDDFFDWVQNKSLETSETVMGGALKNLIVSPLLKSVTVRRDYVILSTYHIDIEGNEVVYLGAFKQFIQIKEN